MAILLNPANPNSALVLEALKRRAGALNVAVEPVEVRGPDELERAFSTMGRAGIDALLVQSETMFSARAKAIGDLAMKHRIAMAGTLDVVRGGGVIGYAANRIQAWPELVGYVDKILKGAKPSDLPVQQPSKVELIINLRTAKALGITIPQALLLRADEVIK